jgi:hypothetical protein
MTEVNLEGEEYALGDEEEGREAGIPKIGD